MKFTAYRSVDMRIGDDKFNEKYDISFFESFDDDYDDIVHSVSESKIVFKEPYGEKYIWKAWSGRFVFKSNGKINVNKSYIGKLQINRSGKLLLKADLRPKISFRAEKSESDYLNFALKGNDIIAGSKFKDILFGGDGDDIITGGLGADQLTGGAGKDTFRYANLRESRLAAFDRITDFAIGTDRIDAPRAVTASNIRQLGRVSALTQRGISSVLSNSSFKANRAATFTLGTGDETRTFLALNDKTGGFSAKRDGLIEITGFRGNLENLAII